MDAKTKKKVLDMIRKGWDNSKIMQKYPDLRRQQIAAIRAHDTMGTYSK